MNKKALIKKLISLLLCAIMVFGTLSIGGVIDFKAFAASGSCGSNVTWSFDSDTGELLISGTGAMTDYTFSSKAPWYSYRKKITKVTIEDGVTSIGDNAFEYCTGLTSITIPDSVTSIGSSAFYNCTGFTSITIPDSVTSIGVSAFDNTAYYNDEDNWQDGVLYIGNCLIKAKNTISGAYKIKDGTKVIAGSAFYNCTGLTSVTIPDSVTSLGSGAFEYCTGLTSITIPDSVTSIGGGAFGGCSNLKTVYYTGNIAKWCAIDFENCYSNPTFYASELCINDAKVEGTLEIPNGVTTIGDYAFQNCKNITSVIISNGVTSIDSSAFSGCTGLTSINVTENNSNYCSIDGALFNKDKTELICYPIGKVKTSYTIPDSVTSIGDYAFQNCTGLTSITIPDSVKSIGSYAFYKCTGLTSITIPDSVKSIGDNAFEYCTGLTSITIPDSVTSIGNYAFRGCTSLTSITIPDSVTSIGEGTFWDCTRLTSITIPDSVTSIGYNAFNGCKNLKTVCYAGSSTQWSKIYIGSDNSYLTSATRIYEYNSENPYYNKGTCGENASWILLSTGELVISGTGAMKDYTSSSAVPWYSYKDKIKKVTIEDGITTIGNYAFYNCTSLTSIKIPDSVTSIGSYAFEYCTSLTTNSIDFTGLVRTIL